MYEFGTGTWKTISDYPYGEYLNNYDMLYVPDMSSYFVIGGNGESGVLSNIVKLKDGAWSDAGKLKTARYVNFC